MFDQIVQWVENLSLLIPLPLFVIIGSFLEEIIPPIPSPLIMASAGSIIEARQLGILYILFTAAAGAVTKTIAGLILYYFSDKIEDLLTKKLGSPLSISGHTIEDIGKHFNNTKKDDLMLFVLRAIPIFPNAPVSILCGAIRLNLKTYISMTFLGTVVKNLLYMYVGVIGINSLEEMTKSYSTIETIGYITLVLATIFLVYLAVKRRRQPQITKLG